MAKHAATMCAEKNIIIHFFSSDRLHRKGQEYMSSHGFSARNEYNLIIDCLKHFQGQPKKMK